MKKVEHSLEFIFDIYWWTRKINNYLKNCWSGLIKKIILIFTTLHFFKKIKEKHLNLNKKNEKNCLEISFYTYLCTINEDHVIYGSWNIRCSRQKLLSFWAIFCPFRPLTTWGKKILKFKKIPEDIIILHICTINKNHLMYGSWDIEHNRENFLSFWTGFCPFTSLCT